MIVTCIAFRAAVALASPVDVSQPGPVNLNSGLVAWWTFNGKNIINNVGDSSGNGNNAFLLNFVATSTALVPGRTGQALNFASTTNVATTTSDLLGTGNLSISAWVYPNAIGGNSSGRIITNGKTELYVNTVNNTFSFQSDGSTAVNSANSSWISNKWVNVVVTRTSGGTANFYVNGVLSGSVNQNSGSPAAGAWTTIGNNNALAKAFGGIIDNLRIYNRVLASSEITRLYNTSGGGKVNVSQAGPINLNSGLIAWWTFDGKNMIQNVVDSSGQGHTGHFVSMPATSTVIVPGKIGQALKLTANPSTMAIQAPDTGFPSGNADRTTAIWFKTSCACASDVYMFGYGTASPNNTGWFIGIYNNGQFVFTNVGNVVQTTQFVNDNRWHQGVVVQRNSSSTLYIDGALSATTNGIPAALNTTLNNTVYIGNTVQSKPLDATLDDVRMYNRALSAREIYELYNATVGNKIDISQTGPGNLSGGLAAWWTFNGKNMIKNVGDSSGNGNNAFLKNFAATSTSVVPGRSGQALLFQPNTNVATTTSDILGTGAVSISAWVYPHSAGGNNAGRILTNGKTELFINSTNNTFSFQSDGSTAVNSANSSWRPTKWVHIVATRNAAGTASMYVNGVLSGSANQNSGTPTAGYWNSIGNNIANTNGFDGIIDNLRIYNRVLTPTEVGYIYHMGL
jgi:hypothetical protein